MSETVSLNVQDYRLEVSGSADPGELHLKSKLAASYSVPPSTLQELMAKWGLSTGKDLVVECHGWQEEGETYRLMAAHILNLILNARDRILANTQRKEENDDQSDEMRDQGFTRPRVLVLLPMRNSAMSLVKALMDMWRPFGQVDNQQRLEREFSWRGEDSDDEQPPPDPNKPSDFNHRFRDNTDDCFRLGVKVTRKSLKLFADFYSADLIIASPLGLRLVIDGQVEQPKRKPKEADDLGKNGLSYKRKRLRAKKGDFDFLSSIQCLLVGEVDSMAMQNWEHLTHCLEHVNQMPTDPHDCDFSRVLPEFLDGKAASLRQSIFLSSMPLADLNNAVSLFCSNQQGKVTVRRDYDTALIKKISKQVKPTFHRFPATNLTTQGEDRLKAVLELLNQHSNSDHVAIFVSSYFDFCLLRQHLLDHDYSLTWLSEYEEEKEITGARAKFFNGHAKILLLTERFHFYRRLRIRGIKHLIFYQPPEHQEYVWELLQGNEVSTCTFVYCQYDWLKMERLVGSSKIESLY